jgi:transcriptional regulator with GAF, ATPase, and Fis domain
MAVHLEIQDGDGRRERTLDATGFSIGTSTVCDVGIRVAGVHGRVLEVEVRDGTLLVRAEPGLPFLVHCGHGEVGTRFETLLDGDAIEFGDASVRLHLVAAERRADEVHDLDPGSLSAPGAPVGAWYGTFMEVADHLEGLGEPADMVRASLEAILSATEADRVHLRLLRGSRIDDRDAFFLARNGDATPFRVSDSLVDRVIETGKVVHVPVAGADPVASQFQSVRREGISSTIALPLTALGRTLGVLYADCVREGGVLDAEDLQRVAFIARLLASALGNHDLVSTLARAGSGEEHTGHPALRTASPACRELVERIKLYAPTDYTVLLRGETGTGKEVMARAIHDLSRRSDGPFVPVNCAAIPESLMESMLFGHEKGAFTGATQARPGHFEEAHGGTLFLDEIGDMAHDLQAKILRVLQDRVVTPVGSHRQRRVDVRILAATHQDLERMVAERRFREDLYYRLRELEVRLPPLRQRLEDVGLLAQTFLAEAATELGFDRVPELAGETLAHLQARPWRGNIRELRFVIKAAALRAGSGQAVRIRHLDVDAIPDLAPPPVPVRSDRVSHPVVGNPQASPARVQSSPSVSEADEDTGAGTWKERLEAQEREALRQTLDEANGNLTKGAALFGVPRTTYREKLVKAGLLEPS